MAYLNVLLMERKESTKKVTLPSACFLFLSAFLVSFFSVLGSLPRDWDKTCAIFACLSFTSFCFFIFCFFLFAKRKNVVPVDLVLPSYLILFSAFLSLAFFGSFCSINGPAFIFGYFDFSCFLVCQLTFLVFYRKEKNLHPRALSSSPHSARGKSLSILLFVFSACACQACSFGFSFFSQEGRLDSLGEAIYSSSSSSQTLKTIATISEYPDCSDAISFSKTFTSSVRGYTPYYAPVRASDSTSIINVSNNVFDCTPLSFESFGTAKMSKDGQDIFFNYSNGLRYFRNSISPLFGTDEAVVPLAFANKLVNKGVINNVYEAIGLTVTFETVCQGVNKKTPFTIVNVLTENDDSDLYCQFYGDFCIVSTIYMSSINSKAFSVDVPIPAKRSLCRDIPVIIENQQGFNSARISFYSDSQGGFIRNEILDTLFYSCYSAGRNLFIVSVLFLLLYLLCLSFLFLSFSFINCWLFPSSAVCFLSFAPCLLFLILYLLLLAGLLPFSLAISNSLLILVSILLPPFCCLTGVAGRPISKGEL